jgi:hypothetical protein
MGRSGVEPTSMLNDDDFSTNPPIFRLARRKSADELSPHRRDLLYSSYELGEHGFDPRSAVDTSDPLNEAKSRLYANHPRTYTNLILGLGPVRFFTCSSFPPDPVNMRRGWISYTRGRVAV